MGLQTALPLKWQTHKSSRAWPRYCVSLRAWGEVVTMRGCCCFAGAQHRRHGTNERATRELRCARSRVGR